MISNMHSNGKVHGIVQPPFMYEEDVRASMLYKMYKMDLFHFLDMYSEKRRTLGVPEAMAKVWLAQLLSSLKVRERLGERERNEKGGEIRSVVPVCAMIATRFIILLFHLNTRY